MCGFGRQVGNLPAELLSVNDNNKNKSEQIFTFFKYLICLMCGFGRQVGNLPTELLTVNDNNKNKGEQIFAFFKYLIINYL